MRSWDISTLDVPIHNPAVLDSEDEGRAIVIQLPAGGRLQEHQVHERAWIAPAAAIRSICSGVFLMIIRDPLGGENRAGRGRRPTGEASVVETYVSETASRGRRDA